MKIYLDDERKEPEGWIRTRTVDETIELLKTGKVTHLSLDHDLALEHYSGDYSKSPTGYDVLVWIESQVAHEGFKPPLMTIHSMNPAGCARMADAIASIQRMEWEPEDR